MEEKVYELDEVINNKQAFSKDKITKFKANIIVCKKVKLPVLVIINPIKETVTIVNKQKGNDYWGLILDKFDDFRADLYANLTCDLKDYYGDTPPCFEATSRCHKEDMFDPIIGLKNAKRKYLNALHKYYIRRFTIVRNKYKRAFDAVEREITRYKPKPVNR